MSQLLIENSIPEINIIELVAHFFPQGYNPVYCAVNTPLAIVRWKGRGRGL